MRKWYMLVVVVALLAAVAMPASALTVWYGGDPNMDNGLRSETGGVYGSSMTYDNFTTTGTGWNVYYLLGNFAMDFQTTQMAYEIRSGVSEGNGGTLISSGTIDVTQTATGDVNNGWIASNVYTLAGNTNPINLAAGEYWVGLAPVMSDPNSYGNAFVCTTTGDGGIGSPLNDGKSFFSWDGYGYNFVSSGYAFGSSDKDFSYGVFANPVVPEPGSMLAMGMGLLSFVPFVRRRK